MVIASDEANDSLDNFDRHPVQADSDAVWARKTRAATTWTVILWESRGKGNISAVTSLLSIFAPAEPEVVNVRPISRVGPAVLGRGETIILRGGIRLFFLATTPPIVTFIRGFHLHFLVTSNEDRKGLSSMVQFIDIASFIRTNGRAAKAPSCFLYA